MALIAYYCLLLFIYANVIILHIFIKEVFYMSNRDFKLGLNICMAIGILTYIFDLLSFTYALLYIFCGITVLIFIPSYDDLDNELDNNRSNSSNEDNEDLPFKKM